MFVGTRLSRGISIKIKFYFVGLLAYKNTEEYRVTDYMVYVICNDEIGANRSFFFFAFLIMYVNTRISNFPFRLLI